MIWLEGAIVQKVERPTPPSEGDAVLLSVRLAPTREAPDARTAFVLCLAGRTPVLGEIERPSSRIPADGQVQRLRRVLEGARVIGAYARGDGFRVAFRRGDERPALLVTGEKLVLVETSDEADPGPAIDDAVDATEAFARHLESIRARRRRALAQAIGAALKKLRRRVDAIDEDLARIGRADEWLTQGTLLVTHAHAIQRGVTSVVLDDWTSGEAVAVTIPLDPAKTGRENAETLFHRAKRLKKGRAIADARRADTMKGVAGLEALLQETSTAADDRALEVLEARAKAAGVRVAKASTTARRARDEAEERLPYTLFLSGERKLLVGRGAADNDALTTKVARPYDLWLHAKGWTGAHVIVPLGKSESCPPQLLVDAAHLAAHFSDARGETVVEVQWAPRKYVRKPKGSAPGAVVVDREKVLVLRVEPARIDRLLATKL